MNDQEINRIDKILDQVDSLVAQLPDDYAQDYAIELCDRFDITIQDNGDTSNEDRKDRRRAYRKILNTWSVYTINGKPRTISDYKKAAKDRFQWMYNKED